MLNVEDRVSQMTLYHVRKIGYKCPLYLKEHFIKISANHKYKTSSSFHFHIPSINSSTSTLFTIMQSWFEMTDCQIE